MRYLDRVRFAVTFIASIAMSISLQASEPVGSVIFAGPGTVAVGEGDGPRPLSKGSDIFLRDRVSTRASIAQIQFQDGTKFLVKRGSTINIVDFRHSSNDDGANDSLFTRLLKGGLRVITGLVAKRNRAGFRLESPVATIGIRGTNFQADLCQGDCANLSTPLPDGLHTLVESGRIVMFNGAGETEVPAGGRGYAANANSPPVSYASAAGANPLEALLRMPEIRNVDELTDFIDAADVEVPVTEPADPVEPTPTPTPPPAGGKGGRYP